MPPILRRPKKKLQKVSTTELPSPPSLEDRIYSQSVYYPILSPPPTLPEDILTRPPLLEESVSYIGPVDETLTFLIEDDLTSDILKEITEAGISPVAKDIDWSLADPQLAKELKDLLDTKAIISEKDKAAMSLSEWLSDYRSENFTIKKTTEG